MKALFFAALSALMMMTTPALARDVTGDVEINNRSILRADDYVWQDVNSSEPLYVDINLQSQMAYISRGTTLIGVTSISSGKTGYDTPEGDFTVLWKEENHHSKAYNAPMPKTMWITTTGIALHSGIVPGYRSSHGCVHLPMAFATKLFPLVTKTTNVFIRNVSDSERMSLSAFLASR